MIPRCTTVVLVTAMLSVVGASVAEAAPTAPTYVALGDSYAAGFGLPAPATPTGNPACQQTSLNYPHRLAGSLGLDLTDVTCSGAVTGDLAAPQDGTGAPPQLEALRGGPDLVTLTVGGNDLGFGSIAESCVATSPTGPLFGPERASFTSCRDYFASEQGRADDPGARLADVQQRVSAAIAAVGAAAPDASLVVVGYPAIAPDAANTPEGGCFTANRVDGSVNGVPVSSAFPFTDVDVPYLQDLQQRFEAGIEAEAAAAGVRYSSVYTDSLAHSACAPADDRWVEPLVPAGGGTNALHPSAAGTLAMAEEVAPVLPELLPVVPPVTAPPATTPPPPTAPVTVAPEAPPAPQTLGAPAPAATPPSRLDSAVPALAVASPHNDRTALLAETGPVPVGPITTVAVMLLLSGTGLIVGARGRR